MATPAALLGINQPKISALRNFKVDGFSVEKLMTFLTALGSDIEIVVRPRTMRHLSLAWSTLQRDCVSVSRRLAATWSA